MTMYPGSRTDKGDEKTNHEDHGEGIGACKDANDDSAGSMKLPSPTVLIVEDLAPLREALRTYLEYFGYVVSSVGGFYDALDSANKRPPDVAICDRQLGEERDGIDVARALQRRHGTRLVFVSATSMTELRAHTADLDVTAYLKKPVLPDRIEAAIRHAVGCTHESS